MRSVLNIPICCCCFRLGQLQGHLLTSLTWAVHVCRGELITNCRSLDGSSPSQCFVEGLVTVQDCADTRNYPTELISTLLSTGKGADGQDGSLCTTMLSSGTPSNSKGAPPSPLILLFSLLFLSCYLGHRSPCFLHRDQSWRHAGVPESPKLSLAEA